jgi:hypothetical protein
LKDEAWSDVDDSEEGFAVLSNDGSVFYVDDSYYLQVYCGA